MVSARIRSKTLVVRLAVMAFVLLAGATFVAARADASVATPAQTCPPPYGCTTTSTTPGQNFACNATFHGTPGGAQTVDVTVIPAVDPPVQVVFDGHVYATGETDANGHVTLAFQVPGGVSGTLQALVVGATTSAACTGSVNVNVGGVGVGRGNGSGNGSLAFTGFGGLLLLLAALALIGAGYLLRRNRNARLHRG